jgi:4-amino-4-deoxy-L-arabinose transferase-like glycosyltransferase
MTFRSGFVIFVLALALRLTAAVVLVLANGDAGLLINDSQDYLRIAADGGPQNQFMPLYLAFLSMHAAMFGASPLWPVLGQIGLDSLTCVAIAALAGQIDRRLTVPAGLAAALNPVQIVMATLVLTETVFVFFSALALLAIAKWMRAPSWRLAIMIGLALGFGILTRAMLLPWLFALPVIMGVAALILRHRLAAALKQGLGATAIGLAMLSPVLIDNYARYDGWGLTAQSGDYALYWLVPLVMEAADGTPHDEGARRMQTRFAALVEPETPIDPFSQSRAKSRAAGEVLGELGPVPIAKAWAYGAAINLLSPAIILATPVREMPRTGFYATPGDSKYDKVIGFLFRNDNPTYGWVLLIATVGTLFWRAVQLRGIWRGMGRAFAGERYTLALGLVLAAWIGFLLAINGPVASAKYRAPAEPALLVLFALGWARKPAPFMTAQRAV